MRPGFERPQRKNRTHQMESNMLYMIEIIDDRDTKLFVLVQADTVRDAMLLGTSGIDPAVIVTSIFARKIDIKPGEILWTGTIYS